MKTKKTNMKTVTLATALMLFLSLPFVGFAQNDGNRGLFGLGKQSADNSYNNGGSLMKVGDPIPIDDDGGITNDSFGVPLAWPWGPLTLRMCAFQPHLLMSQPHRDALLHPRILSPRKALPLVSGNGFSDCKPFTCLTQASWVLGFSFERVPSVSCSEELLGGVCVCVCVCVC